MAGNLRTSLLLQLAMLLAHPTVHLCRAEVVKVVLPGVHTTKQELVTIGELSRVSGGDLIVRRRISELDLVRFESPQKKKKVSRQQVILRIMLAGIPADQFVVTGARDVLVRTDAVDVPGNRVLDFLRPAIAGRLGVEENDIQLKLLRPLPQDFTTYTAESTRLGHFLPAIIRTGPSILKVGIYERKQLIKTAGVSVDIRVARLVQVAQRTLPAGTTISVEDVAQQRRFLSGQLAKDAVVDVQGKSLRRSVQSGSVISALDLHRQASARPEIAIRSRDIVDVIARTNQLQVKISGAVAMQQGAVGDAIRVKNPSTGKVFTAKVLNTGIVEIRL